MSRFSASEAALEGFRLTRENPKAFGAWVGATFLVSALSVVINVVMPPGIRQGLESINASEVLTAPQLLDALIVSAPVLLLGLAVLSIMSAAVYRVVFRHEDTRFGYLRLGADELRLMGLTLIYIFLFIGLVAGVGLISGMAVAAASLAGSTAQSFVSILSVPLSLGFIVFVLVRLSLAPVATFAERRLAVFESWNLTRGNFWPLLGAYTLAVACIAVIGILILFIFSAVAGVLVVANGGALTDVAAILKPKDGSLRSYLSPGLIAYMIVSSVFSALYNVVIAAPGAVAYQRLHGTPDRSFSAQPEIS